MARVSSERSAKSNSPAKWRQPLLDAVVTKLPGSKPRYEPVTAERALLVVLWKGFYGYDVPEREELVRTAIAPLGAAASNGIGLITLTPEEVEPDGFPS